MLNTSPVIRWLIVANLLVHLVQFVLPRPWDLVLVETFSFIAALYTVDGAWALNPVSVLAGPVTYQFLHADLTHLGMNMLLLLAFGTAAARHMTRTGFLALYLMCGVAAAVTWALLHPDSADVLIGASGAISGIIGAVARLSLARGITRRPGTRLLAPSTALTFVVMWIGFNLLFGVVGISALGMDAEVAWEAHLGGFVVGLALAGLFDADRR